MSDRKRTTVRLMIDLYRWINELATERGTDINKELNRLIDEERKRQRQTTH